MVAVAAIQIIKTSIETCDKDVAFIHELCSDNKSRTIAPGTLDCPTLDTIGL